MPKSSLKIEKQNLKKSADTGLISKQKQNLSGKICEKNNMVIFKYQI
jgi:hypothetical protein